MTQVHDTLPTSWGPWLRRLLPALGTALVLAAAIYFFAANWQRIPAAARLLLVEGGLVLGVGAFLALRGRAPHAADAALTAAAVFTGVFWAVFGQIYQTGADAWHLFALWALCVAPWLLVRPATALWALWVTVLNVALVLWSAQTGTANGPGGWNDASLLPALAVDVFLWAACQGAARLRPNALLWSRIVLPFALGCATFLVCAALLGSWGRYPDPVAWPPVLAGLAVLVAVALHAARVRRAFPLFLLALCGYPLINCALLHVADGDALGFTLFAYTAANLGYTLLAARGLLRLRAAPAGATPHFAPHGPTDSQTHERGDISPRSPAARPVGSESVLSHLLGGLGGGLSALFVTVLAAYILYKANALRATGMLTAALLFTGAGLAAARRPGSFARTLSLILPLAGFAFLAAGLADRLGFREAAGGVALATAALYPFHRYAGWRFLSVLSALLLLRVAFSPDFEVFSLGDEHGFLFGDALTLLCALPVLPMAWGRRPSAALRPALYAALLSAALALPAWSPLRGPTLVDSGMASLPVFSPGLQPFSPFTALCGLSLLTLLFREGRLTPVRSGAAGLGLIAVPALAPVEVAFALVLILTGHARRIQVLEILGFVLFGVFLTGYYYLLSVSLVAKAFSIGLPGLALLAGTALIPRGSAPAGATDSPGTGRGFRLMALRGNARGLAAVALLLVTLGAFQYAVQTRETLLERGDVVLLALAPVDPRSIMQGDYMDLAYALENEFDADEHAPRGYVIVRLDERGVGRLADVRPERGDVGPGEYAVPYRHDGWNAVLGLPHSFLFEEGRAAHYAAAAYGILRCAPEGGCLLTGLADAQGRVLAGMDAPKTTGDASSHEEKP